MNEREFLYWTCPNCGANLDIGEKCDCVGGAEIFPIKRQSNHRVDLKDLFDEDQE